MLDVAYEESTKDIDPPFPPYPQYVALPPLAETIVLLVMPAESVMLIFPPLPPLAGPSPPLDITLPVTEGSIVIAPPLYPVPELLVAPFAFMKPVTFISFKSMLYPLVLDIATMFPLTVYPIAPVVDAPWSSTFVVAMQSPVTLPVR
jgi:hypothetical protein